MNSCDHADNNASNISWHIIMKARITVTAFDKDKNEAKRKTEETEPDSNLTCDSNLTWART